MEELTSKVAFFRTVPYFAQRAMNLRRCFVPRQLIFPLAAALIFCGGRAALSQETITLRDGQTQEVRILGVTPSGVKVQMGAAEMVEPFSNLSQVSMNPPPEYGAAVAAFQSGDLQRALTLAEAVVSNYRGLPTDWARDAMCMLGDVYVALGQVPQAEAAYKDYQRAYPGAGADDVNVGLASIDIANKDYEAARSKIQPVLDQALKQRNPPRQTAALIGRAFYISGQIKEHTSDLPGALEDYLRTVTIFPQDRVAAAGAQEAADVLRKTHGTMAP
jgi:tetratricopeptide (TPR) repeat protein